MPFIYLQGVHCGPIRQQTAIGKSVQRKCPRHCYAVEKGCSLSGRSEFTSLSLFPLWNIVMIPLLVSERYEDEMGKYMGIPWNGAGT